MATETLIVGIINLIVGFLILLVPGMLRFLIGGYLLISGLVMVVVPLLS